MFDADLPHGAGRNRSGARSLLLSFMPLANRAAMDASRTIRNVRMDTAEVLAP